VDVGYRDDGTFVLASSEEDWRALEERHRWQKAAGLGTGLVGSDRVRAEAPWLTLPIRGALWCPDDHQVHPRRLLEALRRSLAIRGVRIVSGTPVRAVVGEAGRVAGAEAGGRLWRAPTVVIAAGAWSSGIGGLDPPVDVRPRKGQILALAMESHTQRHVLRWRRHYLLPRAGGELLVGATDEDSGFDRSLTASGVGELLAAAVRMAEGLGRHRLLSAWTGFRPEIADGLPLIGAAAPEGLFYAFGHYRNGILHAPITARLVAGAVRGDSAGVSRYAAFDPMRMAPGGKPAG
jgi:glycine oxidase